MKLPKELSLQGTIYHEEMLTKREIRECETHANVICTYREHLPPPSACHTEEWALGYLCAIRDLGLMTVTQWAFLSDVFQPQEGYGD